MGYSATHGRYVALTIPSSLASGATHTDFPVCFTTANLPSEMFDADGSYPAKSDGSDVRFSSDSPGDTPMNVEVERFGIDNNPANGFAEIWVRIPSFSHTVDTVVYCWWNDPDASAVAADDVDEGSQGVWDSNFEGVWHLSEAVNNDADGYKDATANAAHMTGTSMSITAPTGAWAGSIGAEFDGSADRLDKASALVSAAPATLSAWVKARDAVSGNYNIICINDLGSTGDLMRLFVNRDSDKFTAQMYDGSGNSEAVGTTVLTSTPTWFHLAGAFSSSSASEVFVNGDSEGTGSGSTSLDTMDNTCLGALQWSGGPIQFYPGILDEARISSTARSAEWIAAEYAVINSIASITAGTPGSPSGGITVVPTFGGRSARRLGAPTFGGRAVRRVA